MAHRKAKSGSVSRVVGFNVERLRTARGLTRFELAERAGLHRVTVAQVESSRYATTSFATLHKLAKALGEPIEALFAPVSETIST